MNLTTEQILASLTFVLFGFLAIIIVCFSHAPIFAIIPAWLAFCQYDWMTNELGPWPRDMDNL